MTIDFIHDCTLVLYKHLNKTCFGFRHATTKTWADFGKFGFFRKIFAQKRDPTPAKSCFENIMGNPFFDFLKYIPKLFKTKI